MKKLKILITILLFTCSSFVQTQDLDKFNIYQKIDTTYTLFSQNNKQKLSISLVDNYYDSEFWYREYWVKIYNPLGETIQMLSKINYEAEEKEHFQLKDINFDNYDDLAVLVNQNPFNEYFEFWRFDTLSKKFLYDSLFSEIVSCNPAFNKDYKTVYTGGSDGNTWTFWDETYSYADGKLILVKELRQEQYQLIDLSTNEYSYRRIKKVRQGDEMVIVKEIIGTLKEVDEKWDK